MRILSGLMALFITSFGLSLVGAAEVHLATGVKVGEVTHDSAIVWVRLTKSAERVKDETPRPSRVGKTGEKVTQPVEELPGAAPGAAGRVQVRYLPQAVKDVRRETEVVAVAAAADFTAQFALKNLHADTVYTYEVLGGAGEGALRTLTTGEFRTAPDPRISAPITFAMVTCMMYKDLDHADGFTALESILKQRPHFVVSAGDNVYYDNDDLLAHTVELARYHWHRMYSLPRHVELYRHVPAYWEKDDHDTLSDDIWPGRVVARQLPLTFEDGVRIFREQVPMGQGPTYRTFRWGKELQVWFVEGRDYRSSNRMQDGPEKSIWGAEQKVWLKKTLLESDATWKILVSPTPMVGPDRENKADNHANATFAHEGSEMRAWFAENLPDNFFVLCGDRHWQYHSIDPKTKVHEFACGPTSDQHAGGSPGKEEAYHQFHRVKGGYLTVSVTPKNSGGSAIAFKLRDVDGKVVYEYGRPD
jgi:alkaline phosphatase D